VLAGFFYDGAADDKAQRQPAASDHEQVVARLDPIPLQGGRRKSDLSMAQFDPATRLPSVLDGFPFWGRKCRLL
jgi:hypothetical protein